MLINTHVYVREPGKLTEQSILKLSHSSEALMPWPLQIAEEATWQPLFKPFRDGLKEGVGVTNGLEQIIWERHTCYLVSENTSMTAPAPTLESPWLLLLASWFWHPPKYFKPYHLPRLPRKVRLKLQLCDKLPLTPYSPMLDTSLPHSSKLLRASSIPKSVILLSSFLTPSSLPSAHTY